MCLPSLESQLAAERAARQAAERSTKNLEMVLWKTAAELRARDQQLAALREVLGQTEQALLAYRLPAGETLDELDRQASAALTVARALLAPGSARWPDAEGVADA